jgi:hypothetical protein
MGAYRRSRAVSCHLFLIVENTSATVFLDERVGSMEMVKKWNKLGFISEVQPNPVVFIKTEHTLICEGVYSIASVNTTQNRYIGRMGANDKRPVKVVALSQIVSAILLPFLH